MEQKISNQGSRDIYWDIVDDCLHILNAQSVISIVYPLVLEIFFNTVFQFGVDFLLVIVPF